MRIACREFPSRSPASAWAGLILLTLLLLLSLAGGLQMHAAPREAAFRTGLQSAAPAPVLEIREVYRKLPLHFEANQGQADPEVRFLARESGYSLFLTPTQAVLALRQTSGKADATPQPLAILRVQLVGASPNPQMVGREELPGKVNYFLGNDPTKWRSNLPTYAKVQYRDVYPGVDLFYYGNQRQLEFDFVVAPGADPTAIRLAFTGAEKLEIDSKGDLLLKIKGGQLRQHKPVIYQEVNGVKRTVAGRYVLLPLASKESRREGTQQVGFQVAAYETSRPLIIDPILTYSTYLGGTGDEFGSSVAVDAAGNAYVAGNTTSTNFPTANPLQAAKGGGYNNAFVTKLNAAGNTLIYSTYLGGNAGEEAWAIAVDAEGNAYLTGKATSSNFPTTQGAFQRTRGGGEDAFVTKLNPAGNALTYSTYLGSVGNETGHGIAVDAEGNAWVTGVTNSTNFPTTAGAFQTVNRGGSGLRGGAQDAFVTKLNPSGTALVYSTYLGGSSGSDEAWGIAVDADGNAYVTGLTFSSDFPTVNPLQPTLAGARDAFVTKLNASGTALLYSTYLGGSDGLEDRGFGIAVDASGNAYVTGRTLSTNFPTTPGAFQTTPGGGSADAFVAKLNPAGNSLVYSTFLGGSDYDSGQAIAVDADGNAYVTGSTGSTNFPTAHPLQPTLGGGRDAFVVKLNPAGSALVFSTYLGGSSNDEAWAIAVDADGNAYVTGRTVSTNFPRANPFQATFSGGYDFDAFVAKISLANRPPVSDAGPDQLLSAGATCRASVTLNGSGSGDPDGDTLTYTWKEGETTLATTTDPVKTATVPLGLATHTITLTVDDGKGGTASDPVIVTVRDTTSPVITNVPGPMVVEQASLAGTPVTVPMPTTTDNCGFVTVTRTGPAVFPLGTTTVAFTATDGAGNTSSASTSVTVRDTTPPSIGAVTAGPNLLWPPNHRMVPVIVVVSVSDICDVAPTCQIIAVSSNEPDNGLGDGDMAPDWAITGNLTVNLRAERAGNGTGRVYTLTVRCTDASGNSSTRSVAVTVPHDRG